MPQANMWPWVTRVAVVTTAVAALMTLFVVIADGRYVERRDLPQIQQVIDDKIKDGDAGVRKYVDGVDQQIGERIEGNVNSIGQLHDRLNSAGG